MIITLLTDFGLDDNFVGVVKGVILGINPNVQIIDVSHGIIPGDILQAAFLLKSSYQYFPCGTIHLVVVDPGVGSGRKAIIVKTEKHYFIGPDNGVLSLALQAQGRIIDIVSITNQRFFLNPVSSTFHGRDIFAPVAAYLSSGTDMTEFGTSQKNTYRPLDFPQTEIKETALRGEVVYIDRFGNLVTNIQEGIFQRFVGVRNFHICIGQEFIRKISKSYLESEKNKPLAIFGSFGTLEISVNCGSARDYFCAIRGQKIEVFLEQT